MARIGRGKLVPWVTAAVMWIVSSVADFGPARWFSAGCDRLVSTATVCATLWALLRAYGALRPPGDRANAERDESIGLLLDIILAERPRVRRHLRRVP